MSRPTPSPLARAAAILALVLLVFGLPDLLVLCAPQGGAPHVTWACSEGCHQACRAPATARPDRDDGDPAPAASEAPGGCVHHALGVDLAPPPPALAAANGSELPCGNAVVPDGPAAAAQRRRAWTYATGPPPDPPRPGQTIARLRTTELQV